jgi:hypothetical protein
MPYRSFPQLAILVVLLTGCYEVPCSSGGCTETTPPAGSARASQVVWAVYGESSPIAGVTWLNAGDCDNGQIHSNGVCTDGVFNSDVKHAWIVVVPRDGQTWAEVLVHELLHAHLLFSYGDADRDHTRPEWKTSQNQALLALSRTATYVEAAVPEGW